MTQIKLKKTIERSILALLIMTLFTGRWALSDDTPAFFPITGPCNLEFPKDHGPHPGYRTEWWYYTGNLQSESGHRFGFQFTIFRSQISPSGEERSWPQPASAWRTQQVYLGHAAISDLAGRQHLQAQRVMRGALDMAGVSREKDKIVVFINTWSARIGSELHQLTAQADTFTFDLQLVPTKPPTLHGDVGYSRKGSTPERASCYYSLTRLQTRGTLSIKGKNYTVDGLGWMDHEFSSAPLEPDLAGWDWFSIQLSDQTEMMVYLLRRKDGGFSPASSATFVDRSGKPRHLSLEALEIKVLDTWKSSTTKAVYPARWRVKAAPLALEINIVPNLADQEMQTLQSTAMTYWEGSVSVNGTRNGRTVEGQGYVELTGYAKPFDAPM